MTIGVSSINSGAGGTTNSVDGVTLQSITGVMSVINPFQQNLWTYRYFRQYDAKETKTLTPTSLKYPIMYYVSSVTGDTYLILAKATQVAGTWTNEDEAGQNPNDKRFINLATHANNDEVTYSLVLPAGTYTLKIKHMTGPDNPILNVALDATSKANIDCYSVGGVHNVVDNVSLGTLAGGTYTLHLKCSGKNVASIDYYLSISELFIEKTA